MSTDNTSSPPQVIRLGSRGVLMIQVALMEIAVDLVFSERITALHHGKSSLLGQPLPAGAPFLVTVPLLFTNTVSTALVGVRLCLYRRNKNPIGLWRSKTRVERVFFLLVESGSLYCMLWTLSLVLDLIHDKIGRLDAYRFIGVTYHSIAVRTPITGIYPTLIILVVAMQRYAGPKSFSSRDTRCMCTVNTIEMQERQTTEDTLTVDEPVSSTSKYMLD
ncbi:hypothetical protein EV714DRAFT_233370 [Schizophyllum commune]